MSASGRNRLRYHWLLARAQRISIVVTKLGASRVLPAALGTGNRQGRKPCADFTNKVSSKPLFGSGSISSNRFDHFLLDQFCPVLQQDIGGNHSNERHAT